MCAYHFVSNEGLLREYISYIMNKITFKLMYRNKLLLLFSIL